jgi:glycosyltransferase involved in cell wall biosynthesis
MVSPMTRSTNRRAALNVLMVNTHQSGGGAGQFGGLLAGVLRAAGDHVSAFVRTPRRDEHDAQPAGSWRETRLALWLQRHGLSDLGHFSSLLWRLRSQYAAADVLHLHNLHGGYVSIAALPLWGFDKPVVWTLHDFWPLTGGCAAPQQCTRWRQACGRCSQAGVYPVGHVDRTRLYRQLKPRLIAAAHARLVTPSRWLLERVGELPALRRLPQRVIRPPIDCETFAPRDDTAAVRRQFGLAPDCFTVIVSGNNWSDRSKGAEDAVAALRAAGAAVRRLQVLVVGRDGDRVLTPSGVPGQVLPFIAQRERLAAAYACADVCLFPSRAENYPLTVLESLACGTPVVAYAVGGVPEQIEHLLTGYVAWNGQSVELARGLVLLAREGRRARAMGLRGREFVRRTSAPGDVAEQYRDEYRRAIASWCRRRGRASPRYTPGRWARGIAQRLGWETCAAPQTSRPAPRIGQQADAIPHHAAQPCAAAATER